MIFNDRIHAGKRLAVSLHDYAHKSDAIIIALPRGGVVVGYEVSEILGLPLDIVVPRKIGAPFNPEFAIGAVTETGEAMLSQEFITEFDIPETYIKQEIAKESEKARVRLNEYRKGRPPRDLAGKRVILVDDGLATGSTMRAAIKTVRAELAKEIVVAVPVAPRDTVNKLKDEVDKLIVLSAPALFFAVGQFYEQFNQTSDEEVIELLSQTNLMRQN